MSLVTYPAFPKYRTSWRYYFNRGSFFIDPFLARNPSYFGYDIPDYELYSISSYVSISNVDGFTPPRIELIENSDDSIIFFVACFSPTICCKENGEAFYMGSSFYLTFKKKCCDFPNGLNNILEVLNGG